MRSVAWLLILTALLVPPRGFAEEETGEAKKAPGIEWSKDLATARSAAKAAGKPLLIYFTDDT